MNDAKWDLSKSFSKSGTYVVDVRWTHTKAPIILPLAPFG